MRWLALVLLLPLIGCEPRVVVNRTPSPTGTTAPSSSITASPSPTASAAPTKSAFRPVPSITPAARLLSSERGGDIGRPTLRFLLTDDGRVITRDAEENFVQRRLTPSGTAAMVLQATGTGLFERDVDHGRTPLPGTTPQALGMSVLILVVANGARDVRVSLVPTGRPDDVLYERSAARETLTALARGYEDLASVPAAQWAESTPQPYQPRLHRLFLLSQPNFTPEGGIPAGIPDADTVWPFLTPIDTFGEATAGAATPWRCAILVDDDALRLGAALTTATSPYRYGWGSPVGSAALSWRGATGMQRIYIHPLLPHERATCAAEPPPP